ncbi:MAG: hypothetical protein KJ804_01965 [Proteobacteria bacterium]|nr:hypothetical protein [Pseudomonadota bacterium]MBU1057072.1 hypothetical protein [Pseudomonadota bacterium]
MTSSVLVFLITLLITFSLIVFVVVLISYCKKRQGKTRHGLTGMCHQNGGTMCSSCNSQLQSIPGKDGEDI